MKLEINSTPTVIINEQKLGDPGDYEILRGMIQQASGPAPTTPAGSAPATGTPAAPAGATTSTPGAAATGAPGTTTPGGGAAK
jgi:hypothetical protein